MLGEHWHSILYFITWGSKYAFAPCFPYIENSPWFPKWDNQNPVLSLHPAQSQALWEVSSRACLVGYDSSDCNPKTHVTYTPHTSHNLKCWNRNRECSPLERRNMRDARSHWSDLLGDLLGFLILAYRISVKTETGRISSVLFCKSNTIE